MSLSPGVRLGPYEVTAALGAGGMGEVYRARDTRLGRDVAIKVLSSAVGADPERLARFEQEARAAAALNHPNITGLYDIGTYAPADAFEAMPYLVIEFLEGATLRERMAEGALPLRKAIAYARDIASGLAAAHQKGIVHRDLKPENVFVTTDERAKILDFGLAKLAEPQMAAAGVTAFVTTPAATIPGMVLGTAGYMAPEQVRGLAADHRSDIFAFGAVVYEMLSGQRAFTGETPMDVMMAVARVDPPSLLVARPDLPPSLVRVVERCLEKDPAARFQSTRDLAFTLDGAAPTPSGGLPALPALAGTQGPRPAASRKRWAWLVAGIALGAAGAALVSVARPAAKREAAPPLAIGLPADFPVFRLPGVKAALPGFWNPSPDHRWMLGLDLLADGRTQFVLQELATATSRKLTPTAGNVTVINSAWSPDSKAIAYWDGTDGFLKRLTIETGAITRVGQFRDVRSVSWGPQGIVFSNLAEAVSAAFVVSPDGGPVTQLAAAVRRFEVLPNGWILGEAIGERAGMTLLNTINPPRLLIAGVGPSGYAARHVLYNRQGTLVAHQFDEKTGVLVGDPIPVGEASSDRVFSNDVLLTWVAGDQGLAGPLTWIDRVGRRIPVPGAARPTAGATIALHNDLLATSMQPPGPLGSDLWTIRLDTGALTRVFEGPDTWDAHPRWSRDGARLLFRSSTSLKRVEVGRGATPDTVVSSIPGLERLDDWSGDERHALVSVVTAERRYDVLAVDLRGGAMTPVAATAATESFARFSPDSTLIAYVSDATGPPEVYVQTFPVSGASTKVSLSGGTLPKWSSDGTRIYFFSPDGWIMESAVSRGAGRISPATPVRVVPGSGLDFLPSSDGQRFLVMEGAPTRPLAVANWKALLERSR